MAAAIQLCLLSFERWPLVFPPPAYMRQSHWFGVWKPKFGAQGPYGQWAPSHETSYERCAVSGANKWNKASRSSEKAELAKEFSDN